MPTEMQKVRSSHVWEVGYDPEQAVLSVRYHPTLSHPAGRVIEYLGVDAQTAARVLAAPSTGTALHDFVKGVFEFRG
jgi:hypothetical protein